MRSPNPGLAKTLQFHFRLLVTMRRENIIKAVMSAVHRSDTPHAAASIYSVLNRKILDIVTNWNTYKKNRTLLW